MPLISILTAKMVNPMSERIKRLKTPYLNFAPMLG